MTTSAPQHDPLTASSAAATAVHRASRPGYAHWLAHVSTLSGCEHPIRLAGHLHTLDPVTGEILS
ncbi:MAG: hypothetical protein ACRDT0_25955 [Pseudonocardiaceae bacterium]